MRLAKLAAFAAFSAGQNQNMHIQLHPTTPPKPIPQHIAVTLKPGGYFFRAPVMQYGKSS
jgi:hypothetical protein